MYIQLLFFQLKTHADFFEDEQENPEEAVALSKRASAAVLLGATLLVSMFSEFLVGSIDGFATEMHLSKSFIGIILLPVVGNAVEHVTAVKVALNNKMELAMGVAVGSATQVSLFVVPVVVLSGWFMDQAMSLAFPSSRSSSTSCRSSSCTPSSRTASPTGWRAPCCSPPTRSWPSRSYGYTSPPLSKERSKLLV